MANPSNPTHWIQLPQQTRSRKTMNRILDASKALLEEKTFDAITIAEIVQAADCSIGAFYGRFQDKAALLHALDDYYFKEFISESEAILEAYQWNGRSLEEIINTVISFLVESYSKQKGLLRTLVLRAAVYQDPRFEERKQRAWKTFPQFQKLLLAQADHFTHPDPELAIQFGFRQTLYTLREILLWEPDNFDFPIAKDALITELTRSYMAYLGVVRKRETQVSTNQ